MKTSTKTPMTLCAAAITFAVVAAPVLAAECAMDKRVYSFEPTGNSFNIGMPPTKSFNIGMPPSKQFNIGMPPMDAFIMWDNVVSAKRAEPIKTERGVFAVFGELGEGDVLKGGDIKLFKGSYECKG